MLRAVADTHSVLWYLFGDRRLSRSARAVLDEAAATGDQVGFSSISLAEIVYLIEKGRIPAEAFERLLAAVSTGEEVLVELPFEKSVAEAMRRVDRGEVPDLPDRIIAATAVRFGIPVISRDSKIRLSAVETIW